MDKKKEQSDKHLERSKPYYMENKIMDTDINPGSKDSSSALPDFQIQKNIIEFLEKNGFKKIEIEVYKGVVNLSGEVISQPIKLKIEKTIKSLPGVLEVQNETTVKDQMH